MAPQFGLDAGAIHRFASLILHKPRPHVARWPRKNFLRRLSKLIPQRACILILFIVASRRNRSPVVWLDDHSWIPLCELLDYVSQENFSPTFLFLVKEDTINDDYLDIIPEHQANHPFVCCSSTSRHVELVAIGCEFSRWWGLRSLTREEVDYTYLTSRLSILLESSNRMHSSSEPIRIASRLGRKGTAWSGGEMFVKGVDYDKLTGVARAEQFADALKRLADASFATRARHQPPQKNLISTQAVWWFTELPIERIDFDWFPRTRLASELFGIVASDTELMPMPVSQPGGSLVEAFVENFVEVPPGVYTIGSKALASESEPPADFVKVRLQGFRIFKRPITGTDWRIFSATALPGNVDDSLPVTHCNAFEAMIFAFGVESILKKYGFLGGRFSVALPTEYQWEAAARGFTALDYPWGPTFEKRWCNCGLEYGSGSTVPGRFSPEGDSPFGCQDMSGNVREWTRSYGGIAGVDWRLHTLPSMVRDLRTLRAWDRLVIRGGSYSYEPYCVRTWVRNTQIADRRDEQTGFRIVIEDAVE